MFAVKRGASSVDVTRGEIVEAELDRLIRKRHDRRTPPSLGM